MRKQGLSPARLAEQIDLAVARHPDSPRVSESAIRSYRRGQVPRLDKAMTIARVLTTFGEEMLRAWGYPEAAEGIAEAWHATLAAADPEQPEGLMQRFLAVNKIVYEGEPLTEGQIEAVQNLIRSFQKMNEGQL